MDFSSKLLENAVNEVSRLPGIGSEQPLACIVLKQPKTPLPHPSIEQLTNNIKTCPNAITSRTPCYAIFAATPTETRNCLCCRRHKRRYGRGTAQFRGVYPVLGGKISPIEGIGPQELTIDSSSKK